jgi:hypothetical protein
MCVPKAAAAGGLQAAFHRLRHARSRCQPSGDLRTTEPAHELGERRGRRLIRGIRAGRIHAWPATLTEPDLLDAPVVLRPVRVSDVRSRS